MRTLKKFIRNVPNFPKQGIQFKDITPILACPKLFNKVINKLASKYKNKNITKVVGIDARGFIFGAALAFKLKAGFIPIRKKGKLPWNTIEKTYDLEYGSSTIQMHTDAILEGETVLLIDDLLATGGTAEAAIDLLIKSKANIIGVQFIIELEQLNGRHKFKNINVDSLIKF
jgi:adenine phosphoribosyltransferase